MSGVLAEALDADSVDVKLRSPIPMGTELGLEVQEGHATLNQGEELLAEAEPGGLDIEVPDPIEVADAKTVSERYPGFMRHPWPGCFACGIEREDGDGLRLFPGPVDDDGLLAAPWIPAEAFADEERRVRSEFVWAAFDCPQLWSVILSSPEELRERFEGAVPTFVTGQLVSDIREPVVAGEPHVILSWPMEPDGRKLYAGGALFNAGGDLLALSRQTIFVLPE